MKDWQALREEIGAGSISIRELVGTCLSCIKARNDALNAYLEFDEHNTLEAAIASDRRYRDGQPLSVIDGLPIAVKDNIDVNGWVTSAGIVAYADNVAGADAPVVRRLRAAGAILLGKTNLDEAALGATTDNPWFGRTYHPLRSGHTPGGSSGGSACAVAAGMALAALGTDTLGSVRLPASYCGLVGLKPSAGAVPIDQVVPLAPDLDTVGPLALSVADTRDVFDVITGRMLPGSPLPASRQTSSKNRDSIRLWVPADLDALKLDDVVLRSFVRVLDHLQAKGVILSREAFLLDASQCRYAGLLLVEHEAARFHAPARTQNPDEFSPVLNRMLDYGLQLSEHKLNGAQALRQQVRDYLCARLAEFDALLLPTAPQLAFSFDDPVPRSQADLTGFVNLSGCPALTLPVPVGGDLPWGVQLVGARDRDYALLDIGLRIEADLSDVPGT
jgi:aspartyl-tRNA(Asn)/glutamyl-tRNA(Gln) amidotransferase subunit A